jgi:hypothetical protein
LENDGGSVNQQETVQQAICDLPFSSAAHVIQDSLCALMDKLYVLLKQHRKEGHACWTTANHTR